MNIAVRLTVTYRSDPERVRDVLLATARDCGGVAAEPPPLALLDEFAEHGFAFLLKAHCADASAIDEAASTLRFAIARALRAHDIELAVPQSDIRWRDLDFVRQAFALAAERAAKDARSASE